MRIFWQPDTLSTHHHTLPQPSDTNQDTLPITKYKLEFLFALDSSKVVIIIADTGSGKSTMLPQFILDANYPGSILCTQPTALATISIASRVAHLSNSRLGHKVGYLTQFENSSTQNTRLLYLTDSMLLRTLLADPLLSKYSVVMIDDAHERTLYSEIALGLFKKIILKRPEFRIIISSATIDAKTFKDFFSDSNEIATILSLSGRLHKTHSQYLIEPCLNYIDSVISTILDIHKHEKKGDILVFVPSSKDVDLIIEKSRQYTFLFLVPLHHNLQLHQQMNAINSPSINGKRKVIVATSLAETSITIPGIVYIIDSGLIQTTTFLPKSGLKSTITTTISKSTAKQRAGRAGRTSEGKVYRLYTFETFDKMQLNSIPQVQRTNLAHLILLLKSLGIENIARFDFVSPPPPLLISHALELLYSLKTIDEYGKLTVFGTNVAESPLDPMISVMLLTSQEYGCSEEILTLSAMLSIPDIFTTRKERDKKQFAVEEGDHLTLINVYNSFIQNQQSRNWCNRKSIDYSLLNQAVSIRLQLKRWLLLHVSLISSSHDPVCILKCILTGFFSHVARLSPDGSYFSVRNTEKKMWIHESSVLKRRNPEWITFFQVEDGDECFMKECSAVEGEWIMEVAKHYYQIKGISSGVKERVLF